MKKTNLALLTTTFLKVKKRKYFAFLIESEKDFKYITRAGVFKNNDVTVILGQIKDFRSFLSDYNVQVEKKKLTQEIVNLKPDILQSETEFNLASNEQLYFSKIDF